MLDCALGCVCFWLLNTLDEVLGHVFSLQYETKPMIEVTGIEREKNFGNMFSCYLTPILELPPNLKKNTEQE